MFTKHLDVHFSFHHRKTTMNQETEAGDHRLLTPNEADEAVRLWSDRARETFRSIHEQKTAFFAAIFHEAPWADCFPFADQSRRFSAFVKLVFAQLDPSEVGTLPSSTEVNQWFWLFLRQEQFRAAEVSEAVIPTTRKVQEALSSATAGLKSDQDRLEAQVEILQRVEAIANETGKPVSAGMVAKAAAELEIRQPLPKLPPFEARKLQDLNPQDWQRFVTLAQQLRQELLEPKPDHTQRARLLRLSATLEDLARHQTVWVCAVFEEERFVGVLSRKMGQKTCLKGEGAQKRSFKVHALLDHQVIAGDALLSAQLPMAARPEHLRRYHRLVGCRGDRKIRQMLKHGTTVIQPDQALEPIDQQVLQQWLAHGGIPIGTYLDEVTEPTWDDESPVL